MGDTAVWWIIDVVLLTCFAISKRHFFPKRDANLMYFISLYLFWNAFSIIRGFFIADTYWDWKGLMGNAMALTIPVVAYVAANTFIAQKILRGYIWITLPLFSFFAGTTSTDAFGFYLIPISFIVLFFPVVNISWRIVILSITVFVITVDFGARSNIIKFAFPILLVSFYYLGFFRVKIIVEFTHKLLFVLPLIFLSLGLTDTYNVFNSGEQIDGEYVEKRTDVTGESVEDNVKSDTRTFLYEEVLATAKKYDTWWIGRSPARGNETSFFGDLFYISGRQERLGNEVAILNVFTWTGMIGVMLYFLCFYKASKLAVSKSRNTFSRMLGLLMAFHWCYSWIENVNYFTLNTFSIWFFMGLALSSGFRHMTDEEVESWIRGVFRRRNVPSQQTTSVLMRCETA
jgi:hypothetical protein